MKLNTLTYTPHITEFNNNFGYQPKYLGKISNYRSVQEVPVKEVPAQIASVQESVSEPEAGFIPQQYTPKPGFENKHNQFTY